MEKEEFLFIDCRSAKDYDRAHITKPPQKTRNIPMDGEGMGERELAAWVKKCAEKTRPSMKLLVADVDGTRAEAMVRALRASGGYANAFAVEGGYNGWTAKYTTFGRKVPPKGRFVSTGKEALKSGLDLDATVAAAYEENWGKAPPKHGDEAAAS